MPFDTKFEFILQFEKILGEMKKKNPETYQRNIQFLSSEPMQTIVPVLQKFFPSDKTLIDTLTRKDIDLMLMRILRSEIVTLQGEGERLVGKARTVVTQFGFLPPVAFFYAFNGAEIFEAMVERIYSDLKKRGKPQSLSDIWKHFSAPLAASFELKNVFTKDLLFKIRQRLKNFLEKDRRFVIDAPSPKKLVLRLAEWGEPGVSDL
ncbi:MAG TPA: hypothetical protein PKM25_15045 [Candidatus Ozemobacteraceae bacterium]|nr:hypothetical protein [Candidatus Ozemobacteraceae bacterium]